MHQAKIEELVAQAKALQKAVKSGAANPAVGPGGHHDVQCYHTNEAPFSITINFK